MRLLRAMMKHETNTFSPVLTDLARFPVPAMLRRTLVTPPSKPTAAPAR